MINYLIETVKIERMQYVCDKCGIKSKRFFKNEEYRPSGLVVIGFLQHYCPMCAGKIDKRVEAATK